jgi:hypothetical protein
MSSWDYEAGGPLSRACAAVSATSPLGSPPPRTKRRRAGEKLRSATYSLSRFEYEGKVGFIAVAVVLALLGFALAGAVAHGAPSHRSDATTATERTSTTTTTTATTTITTTTTTTPTTPGPGLPTTTRALLHLVAATSTDRSRLHRSPLSLSATTKSGTSSSATSSGQRRYRDSRNRPDPFFVEVVQLPREAYVSVLWIILIVVLVLALLSFIGR